MKIEFSGIVQMFQLEGMVALGKIHHPVSNQLERNLQQAEFIIDLLGVLQEKSRGNLSESEERLLAGVLADLRLNYVHETSNPSAPPAAEKA